MVDTKIKGQKKNNLCPGSCADYGTSGKIK